MTANFEFNSFSSYFQLAAAFCLTYSTWEKFMEGISDRYLSIDGLKDYHDIEKKDIDKYLHKKNPLLQELNFITLRHRLFFFHTALTCIIFLAISGFEKFYTPVSNSKICGIIMIPFLSIIPYYYFISKRVLSQKNIEEEIEKIISGDLKYKFSFKTDGKIKHSLYIHLGTFILGLITIFLFSLINKPMDQIVFSHVIKRILILFCLLIVLLPFFSQYFQFKRAIKIYTDVIESKLQILKKQDEDKKVGGVGS